MCVYEITAMRTFISPAMVNQPRASNQDGTQSSTPLQHQSAAKNMKVFRPGAVLPCPEFQEAPREACLSDQVTNSLRVPPLGFMSLHLIKPDRVLSTEVLSGSFPRVTF